MYIMCTVIDYNSLILNSICPHSSIPKRCQMLTLFRNTCMCRTRIYVSGAKLVNKKGNCLKN